MRSGDRPTVRYSGGFDTFDADELAALARAAADEQDATLYLTAAMTGLRLGELLALRWRDVDFAGQRVHVRRAWSKAAKAEKAPKSGMVRSVPLVAELVGPLDRLSRREHFTAEDDLVFCSVLGEHLDHYRLTERYHAALEAAGLRRIRFHDLRHCFGSVAVRAFPLSDVQAMLGHAHVTTTMRYVHHRPGADDAARLSGAFRGDAVSPLVSPKRAVRAQLSATQRYGSASKRLGRNGTGGTSKPVSGGDPVVGRFDSYTAPWLQNGTFCWKCLRLLRGQRVPVVSRIL